MPVPRTILVPIDLSARSLVGLEYAAALAKATGGRLVLFCNVNLPERAVLEEFALAENISVEEAGEEQLRMYARERAEGVEADVMLGFDDSPSHGILQAAELREADLIVVASHGRTGMSRLLLGSIAEAIARTAAIPVLIVPARTGGDDQ